MALSIKDPEADLLARRLAALTGESLTEAVLVALRERLTRARRQAEAPRREQRLNRLRAEFARLRVLDRAKPDAILGYDEDGLPR